MVRRGSLLEWPGCRNARDVGGLETQDGRRVRTGALLRTDSLDQLDDDGLRAVRALRPALVLDLRSAREIQAREHPFAADPAYRCIPFIDPKRDEERDFDGIPRLADRYRASLDRNGRQIATIVAAIGAAPPGPVIVHCMSGKDRTGMLVALLLNLVGVPDDAIADDYARSEECLGLAESDRPHDRTSPDTMAALLAHLHHTYGDAAGYLAAHRVPSATVDRIRDRLLAAAKE